MKCPECNVQQLQGLTKPIKEGYLLKHKKRVFGKDWKEHWVVLYEDSTMAWYKNQHKQGIPLGTIFVREAPEMLAVGEFTFRIPGTPLLPPGSNYNQLMAFGSRLRDEVHWLLATSDNEVSEWMTAISNTLPPAHLQQEFKTKIQNDSVMIYNKDGINMGSLCGSEKPSMKKCKNCCTSCEYSTNCYLNDRETASSKCCQCQQQKIVTKSRKLVCECGTGFLMGHTMANVATGWRGWGEGIGWQIAGLSGVNCTTAATFADPSTCLPSHDLGDVDYENSVHTITSGSALTYEAHAIMDSTSESTGFLSFDFFL